MRYDLKHPVPPLPSTFDVCVVGAGPAGITVARELARSGFSILLAESGGLAEREETNELNVGDSVGHPSRMHEGRHRVFGGSSTKWGGRCAMLDPIDLESRGWIQNSGWPFSYGELLPYYERAKLNSNFLEPWADDAEALNQLQVDLPRFKTGNLKPYVWRVPQPYLRTSLRTHLMPRRVRAFDWGDAFSAELFAHRAVHVLLNATLVSMQPTEDGSQVNSMLFSSLSGNSIAIAARHFVLCCSGIENARILLNAPAQMQQRMNRYDNIGKFLTQHPRGTIGDVKTHRQGALRLQRTFNSFQRPPYVPVQYEVGFALTETAQRDHKLVNASAVLIYRPGELSSWASFKRLRHSMHRKHIDAEVLKDAFRAITRFPARNLARRFLLGREVHHSDPVISVDVDLEQMPIRDSRIYLSNEKDILGVRRVVVDWRISDIERRTAAFFGKILHDEFARFDLGHIELPEWLTNDEPLTDAQLHGAFHYIGATRMSATPEHGVVNENAQVHGVRNLYVSGASVFPTGGHANPTLTIVALSIRLADHLQTVVD